MTERQDIFSPCYVTREIAETGRIVVSRTPGSVPSDLDLLLEQAISDDLRNNHGRMFGHDVLNLFTMMNTYPETWACVARTAKGAILERTPSHPHQSVVRYRYEASRLFGGVSKSDAPCFTIIDTKEASNARA